MLSCPRMYVNMHVHECVRLCMCVRAYVNPLYVRVYACLCLLGSSSHFGEDEVNKHQEEEEKNRVQTHTKQMFKLREEKRKKTK